MFPTMNFSYPINKREGKYAYHVPKTGTQDFDQ